MELLSSLGQALLMAFGMFWKTGWSLVLGFSISAVLQAVVSKDRMRSALGRAGPKQIALATALGAASSSCSYASAAISRTLFKKGAALIPSLAFQFASTNLVVELGLVLLILMGWQFMAAEWIGGVVLVIIMALLVRLTYPAKLVEEARHHPEAGGGNQHDEPAADGASIWQKLRQPATRIAIAHNFVMDWRMLW
ncbi:MAG: permease, partial [Rhodomicrobium sp.]